MRHNVERLIKEVRVKARINRRKFHNVEEENAKTIVDFSNHILDLIAACQAAADYFERKLSEECGNPKCQEPKQCLKHFEAAINLRLIEDLIVRKNKKYVLN